MPSRFSAVEHARVQSRSTESGLQCRPRHAQEGIDIMKLHPFGSLPPASALTLGGGGIGMLWGVTTDEECVATVRAAVEAGINLLDMAPRYGDGKAESIVGEALGGRLPAGVRVTSKC